MIYDLILTLFLVLTLSYKSDNSEHGLRELRVFECCERRLFVF